MESKLKMNSLENLHSNTQLPNPKDTYTVKYIGVVKGTMGILSRKMKMPNSYNKYVLFMIYII